jgi:hypothetical protein
MSYYKGMRSNMTGFGGYKFEEGINIDWFFDHDIYKSGGFHFSTKIDVISHCELLGYTHVMEVNPLGEIITGEDKMTFKCQNIVLSNFMTIRKFVELLKHDELISLVRRNPSSIKYIIERKQSIKLCIIAVTSFGMNLQYVKNQSKEICMEAVKNFNLAFKYVEPKYKTRKMRNLFLEGKWRKKKNIIVS